MARQFLKTSIMTSVLALTITACGSDSSSNSEQKLSANSLSESEASALNGAAWSSCSGGGINSRYYFEGNQFASTLEYYSTNDCQGEITLEEMYLIGGEIVNTNNIVWTGEVIIGDTITANSGVNATEINFKYFGIERYDIFYIQDDNLYLGASNGVFNEADRDTDLDFDNVWVREI